MRRFVLVAITICVAACTLPRADSVAGKELCLSEWRDGATEFLLSNADETVTRVVADEWIVLRSNLGDRFRIMRSSQKCEANEKSITFEQGQETIESIYREFSASVIDVDPNQNCWAHIKTTKIVDASELLQALGKTGLRYAQFSGVEGDHYDVGSQDECRVVETISRSIIEKLPAHKQKP